MTPGSVPENWDEVIARLPNPHILQTREWAAVKARYGWRPYARSWPENLPVPPAAALILERSLRLGPLELPFRVLYVPRGPLLDWQDESCRRTVLDDLQNQARSRGAIFIKIDPEVLVGTGLPGEGTESPLGAEVTGDLQRRGWIFSGEQVQFRNTMCIDLSRSEQEILERMKPKMRYNLRLAERKGVAIRSGGEQDLGLLYAMYAETSVRDGFVIREEAYYREVWSRFTNAGLAEILIAEVEGEAVAALVLFRFGARAWYLYGMSRVVHREKMPNVLLQWQAIRRAKAAGCQVYDLWGAPDEFTAQDSMWGVYRFKEGLGAEVIRTLGAWDFPVRRNPYLLYTRVLPAVLGALRRRGMRAAQHRVQLT